jgi:hypothetical protein
MVSDLTRSAARRGSAVLQVAGESELQLSEGCCCVLTAGSSYALERERGSVGMVLSCDPRGNRSLSR